MTQVKLSSKYQLVIPKKVRETLGLSAGQEFTVLTRGKVIELVPVDSLESARGLLKGANPKDYRDHQDRF
ncbi:MAG: AbrB/MazE/SpoVT family DNA-binding domain-containing protein [Gammaproteobacteria bacterium]|nr:MAG: AbrB/MazE/SpoVT family DNA-binding domain-containing protein [Gammaproteobacteria bacterium]RTZ76330.1 MAG: AbrB/MazE/SpoVT family DNA-binding domain-containing protein [Gammaproteobacteria bacterium]RTZ78942.1 MAG: AbrB/MazE/SpoVT family DNA-binding domain-containing protein [Gammaproteobacteria bacterium]